MRIIRVLSITVVTLIILTSVVGAYPKYWCQWTNAQRAGQYEGCEWYDPDIPPATLTTIRAEGCAISSAAMDLYPATAHIYDERYGQWRDSPADPYVAYRANNDSTTADWKLLGDEFEKPNPWIKYVGSWSDAEKALRIAVYLEEGQYPVGRLPGHFILFVDHYLDMPQGLELPEGPAVVDPAQTVESGYIRPPTWTDRSSEEAVILGEYDHKFRIHDPGQTEGIYLYFDQNLHGSSFSELDKLIVYDK